MPPVYFRYILPHNTASDRDLLYFPYWRFKGMIFSCVTGGRVDNRFVDTSQQAVTSKHFPFSAGLRPQVGKLTFATKKSEGRFIRPDVAYADVIDLFKNSLTRFLPKPIYHQTYVGDTVSLLYAPFYISDRLFDAVLNKPITNDIPDDLAVTLETSEKIQNETRFFSAICPACGWNLEGEGDASVLLCKNCQTAWQPTQKGFTKLPFVYLTEMGQFKISLPFWRITADIDGISLSTIADLARLANLSDMARRKDTQTRFHFWVPAFKVQPKVLLTLCRRITVAQPMADGDRKLPEGVIVPANLPVTEASQALKIVLAEFAKPSKAYFPKLNQIRITPRKALLVYIPFNEDHHDFIQPKLNLGLRKRLLTLAENL